MFHDIAFGKECGANNGSQWEGKSTSSFSTKVLLFALTLQIQSGKCCALG